jgi:hypothetical protein
MSGALVKRNQCRECAEARRRAMLAVYCAPLGTWSAPTILGLPLMTVALACCALPLWFLMGGKR